MFQVERDWSAAELKKDLPAFDRILANDWSGISAEGAARTKTQYLASLAAADSRIDSQNVTESRVRLLGSVAIATVLFVRSSEGHGRDTSGHFIRTDIFVKRDGAWLAVESQESRVPRNPRP